MERLVWYAMCLTVALGMIVLGARFGKAQDVQMGSGLICDTQEQVEKFTSAWDGDTQAALTTVNAEVQPPPCGVVAMAYVRDEKVGQIRKGADRYDILRIIVVAINLGAGWIQGPPLVQFTLLKSEDREA